VKKHGEPTLKMTDQQRERVRRASMFCVAGKATVHTNFKSGKVDQIPHKAGVGRDYKSFEAILLGLQVMHCIETGDPKAEVQDWHIDIIDKCAYSSINRERRAILEILANTSKSLSASEIGASRGLGLEREGVEVYLNPLFAVGLIKRNVESANKFKWFIEDEENINFIKKVSSEVPQIKLKEDEPVPEALIQDEEADEEFDNYGEEKTITNPDGIKF